MFLLSTFSNKPLIIIISILYCKRYIPLEKRGITLKQFINFKKQFEEHSRGRTLHKTLITFYCFTKPQFCCFVSKATLKLHSFNIVCKRNCLMSTDLIK